MATVKPRKLSYTRVRAPMYPIYPLISPLYLLRVFSVATVATQRNTYAEQRVRREPSGRYAGRSRWPRWPRAGVFLPQVATVVATVRGYGGQTVASAAIVLFVGFPGNPKLR